MNLKIFSLALVTSSLTACATKQIPHFETTRETLFQDAVYEQSVTIRLPHKNKLEMKGILELKGVTLKIVGLSPFQTTIFKIEDTKILGSIPKIQIFDKRAKKLESKIQDYYDRFKPILLLKKSETRSGRFKVVERDSENFPLALKSAVAKEGESVELGQYDANNIPTIIHLRGEKLDVEIETLSYH